MTTPLTAINHKVTFDELSQMNVPQLPDVIHDGEILDSDKNLREDVLIGLILVDSDLVGNLVKLRQDKFWLNTDPHGNNREGLLEVGVTDVQ